MKVLVLALKVAPEGRLEAEYVNVFPSASVAESAIVIVCPAVTERLPIGLSIGALFTDAPLAYSLAPMSGALPW